MITSDEFARKLCETSKQTPLTEAFENELDENGCRKYAQKKKRWWDYSTKSQKEHVVCWFALKNCSEGSTEECIRNNGEIHMSCYNCYFKGKSNQKFKVEPNASKVFTRMNRPEMFLWIAEVLGILDDEKLRECISKLKHNEKPRCWKHIIWSYFNWEDVETKIF